MFYLATSTQLLLPHTENIAVEGETDLELRLVVAGEVGLDGGHCDQKKETLIGENQRQAKIENGKCGTAKNCFVFQLVGYVATDPPLPYICINALS
jgi:hypothetical protein